MQELRYILVALGGIAIAALLIHGLWSNRKNRQAPIKEKPLGRMESKSRDRDNDAFDSDGIGQVRVVSGGRRAEPKLRGDEARLRIDLPQRRPGSTSFTVQVAPSQAAEVISGVMSLMVLFRYL